MSERGFEWPSLDDLIHSDKPICYGVLKPGVEDPHGIPLVRIVDIDNSELRSEGLFRITPALDKEFGRSRIDVGDLLLSIQGTVGRVAIVPPEVAGANISRTIARLSFAEAGDAKFYKHWFLSSDGLRAIDGAIVGTTRASLNIGVLRKVAVPSPNGTEKVKIAEVLDTLDTAIRKTEAIIEKLKQVKQGLLHDLLTRGIDANGELRPPQSQAPHLYKDSPLGWIPREWQLRRFRDIGRAPQLGLMVRGDAPDGLNVGLLKMGNLLAGNQLDLGYVELLNVRRIDRLEDYVLADGDLLFNTRNTPDLVGKTCSWRGRFGTTVFDNNILRMRLAPSVGNGHFIASYMGAAAGRARLLGLATGTTSVAAIYWKDLQHFVLPLPESQEQNVIVERLDACDQRMDQEKAVAGALAALKSGLMDDLLTGRVRVTPLLRQEPAP